MPDDKLPITIVNGLINDAIEKVRVEFQNSLTQATSLVNTNSEKTEAAIKTLNDAVSTLDKDFKASTKKPFSLGFLEFDFEE